MCFLKEHDLAQESFHQIDENLGFTHNVSNSSFYCYISFKKDDEKFNGDIELEKFNKLFEEHELADEAWNKFYYKIKKVPNWLKFDFEFTVYTERVYFFDYNCFCFVFRFENVY